MTGGVCRYGVPGVRGIKIGGWGVGNYFISGGVLYVYLVGLVGFVFLRDLTCKIVSIDPAPLFSLFRGCHPGALGARAIVDPYPPLSLCFPYVFTVTLFRSVDLSCVSYNLSP